MATHSGLISLETLTAYTKAFGSVPKKAEELVKYSKTRNDVKTLQLAEAKEIIKIYKNNLIQLRKSNWTLSKSKKSLVIESYTLEDTISHSDVQFLNDDDDNVLGLSMESDDDAANENPLPSLPSEKRRKANATNTGSVSITRRQRKNDDQKEESVDDKADYNKLVKRVSNVMKELDGITKENDGLKTKLKVYENDFDALKEEHNITIIKLMEYYDEIESMKQFLIGINQYDQYEKRMLLKSVDIHDKARFSVISSLSTPSVSAKNEECNENQSVKTAESVIIHSPEAVEAVHRKLESMSVEMEQYQEQIEEIKRQLSHAEAELEGNDNGITELNERYRGIIQDFNERIDSFACLKGKINQNNAEQIHKWLHEIKLCNLENMTFIQNDRQKEIDQIKQLLKAKEDEYKLTLDQMKEQKECLELRIDQLINHRRKEMDAYRIQKEKCESAQKEIEDLKEALQECTDNLKRVVSTPSAAPDNGFCASIFSSRKT